MPLCTVVLVKLFLLPQQQVTSEEKEGRKNRGCNVDTFSYCICNVVISVDFPQMSWERDMDEQLTPEAWATMQKLSSSVRHIFIILRFVREIHDVHEIILSERI